MKVAIWLIRVAGFALGIALPVLVALLCVQAFGQQRVGNPIPENPQVPGIRNGRTVLVNPQCPADRILVFAPKGAPKCARPGDLTEPAL